MGLFAGWRAAHHYLAFLLAFHGVPFGKADPVFGHDLGFYVYWLPILRLVLAGLSWALFVSVAANRRGALRAMHSRGVLDAEDDHLLGKGRRCSFRRT
jgi:uncharacterized membrane protein (UPF0182 family)